MGKVLNFAKDSLVNFVSMLGTSRDKSAHNQFVMNMLDRATLDAMYRGDWIAGKAVDIVAEDATREWRSWQAADGQIQLIEEVEKSLSVQQKVNEGLIRARLYGGGGLLIGIGDDPTKELNPDSVPKGGLKYLHVFSRHELAAGQKVTDINSPWFGLPSYYTVNTASQTGDVTPGTQIHPSRVVRFVGRDVPDRSLLVDGAWGDSVLQSVQDAITNAASSSAGIASLIQEAKIDVVRIPGFMEGMADPDYRTILTERFEVANMTKSLVSTLVLDKEEEWQRITTNFAGLPDILKLYLLITCAAVDIPATRFLGQSAVGLGATGEGDQRNYYDNVGSKQKNDITPALKILDEVIIRSALGSRPKEVHYSWVPLWQMDAVQKSTIAKAKADTTKVYYDMGVFEGTLLTDLVVNQVTEDGLYPGIEAAIAEWEAAGGGLDEDDPESKDQFETSRRPGPPLEDDEEESGGRPTPDVRRSPAQDGVRRIFAGRSRRRVEDAKPRTLYVRRDVMNAEAIVAHYAAQLPEDEARLLSDAKKLHVTIAYSRAPVDWIKVGEDYYGNSIQSELVIPAGGARLHERLGAKGDAVVLQFTSSRLGWRWKEFLDAGASWDFPEYQPHVTLAWDTEHTIVVEDLKPWRGEIVLGFEVFEEIDEDWKAKEGIDE